MASIADKVCDALADGVYCDLCGEFWPRARYSGDMPLPVDNNPRWLGVRVCVECQRELCGFVNHVDYAQCANFNCHECKVAVDKVVTVNPGGLNNASGN